jgi:hypothetical protein
LRCPTPLRRVFLPLFRDVKRPVEEAEDRRAVDAKEKAERLLQRDVGMMPQHQALHHLRLEAQPRTFEHRAEDFRHWLAGHTLDMRERSEVHSQAATLDDLFIVEDQH